MSYVGDLTYVKSHTGSKLSIIQIADQVSGLGFTQHCLAKNNPLQLAVKDTVFPGFAHRSHLQPVQQ